MWPKRVTRCGVMSNSEGSGLLCHIMNSGRAAEEVAEVTQHSRRDGSVKSHDRPTCESES